MNVEEELRKINFASLSRVREGLLHKILLTRKLHHESDKELSFEKLDFVSAAKNLNIVEEKLK